MKKNFFNNLKSIAVIFIKNDIMALSSQLAYSLLFSSFPFLIFIISLIGYIPLENSAVITILNGMMPEEVLDLIQNTVLRIVNTRNMKMVFLSLIFTLWPASSGFQAVIRGLNKAYDLEENRSIFKLYTISLICTLGIILIILVTIMLLVFGQIIGKFFIMEFHLPLKFSVAWNFMRYLIILISMSSIFAAVYKYTPNIELTWKEILPGAIASTLNLVIVSIGFAFYVNNFANYSLIYGSIGAVIVLLTWLFILSNITIIGGEINSILYNK